MNQSPHTTAITLFAIGNRSRGDDAAAPYLMDLFNDDHKKPTSRDTLIWEECYQLQPEHCYDIEKSQLVIFIDSITPQTALQNQVQLTPIVGELQFEFSTHILSPTSLLALFEKTFQKSAPHSWQLAIPGYHFELGDAISEQCESNITQAFHKLSDFLKKL